MSGNLDVLSSTKEFLGNHRYEGINMAVKCKIGMNVTYNFKVNSKYNISMKQGILMWSYM